jgi:hypothetical protein
VVHRLGDGLVSISRLGDYDDSGRLEQAAEPLAEQGYVVGDDYSHGMLISTDHP